MLKNWTKYQDEYIIQNNENNIINRFDFLDDYKFIFPNNNSIEQNSILVLDNTNNKNIYLKWQSFDKHDYIKSLLNMIDELNKKNLILEEQLNKLQNTNNELLTKTNYNENNIIKVNNKILDDRQINELISSRLNILQVTINNKLNNLENLITDIKNEKNIKDNEIKDNEIKDNEIKDNEIKDNEIKDNESNSIEMNIEMNINGSNKEIKNKTGRTKKKKNEI